MSTLPLIYLLLSNYNLLYIIIWKIIGTFLLPPPPQVQDIEFAQIEMKVIEGLKVGNDCLQKMHEVCIGSCLLISLCQ